VSVRVKDINLEKIGIICCLLELRVRYKGRVGWRVGRGEGNNNEM